MSPSEQLSADQFVLKFRPELVPINSKVYWFSIVPMGTEDLASNVEEPLASLPPRLVELLPRLNLFLVPFLKSRGKLADLVVFDTPEPGERSESFQLVGPEDANILLAAQEVSGNEIHYNLFSAIASLAWEVATADIRTGWSKELKEELRREVHGEIDEASWQKKNELLAKQSTPIRDSKLFRDYARTSFIDTLTLFLHGICCDIDVEPSPRQAPSSEIRRRLELLRRFYPLGEGFYLFPEELNKSRGVRESWRRGAVGDSGKGQSTNGTNGASSLTRPSGSDSKVPADDSSKPEA